MKKVLSILLATTSILSFASCSVPLDELSSGVQPGSSSSDYVEKNILDKEFYFGDFSIRLPQSAKKGGSGNDDLSEGIIVNLEDESCILFTARLNDTGNSFSSMNDDTLYNALESSVQSGLQDSDPNVKTKRATISGCIAVRFTSSMNSVSTINYCFTHNDIIYVIWFMYDEGKTDAIAPTIADDAIQTITFLQSDSTSENVTEKTTEKPTEPPTTKPNISKSQEKALKSAKSYISFSAFSYNELIEQLEYEQFSYDDAVYAANNCGADWYAEAVEQAKSYISHSAFSYGELYEQLTYEQFTDDQARYGVDNCGADWYAEAVEQAKSYISHSAFSYEELYEQLTYEQFTDDQARYGVDNCGADWYAEAVEQAKSYISHSSFTYDELYDQLIYEGFTPEQAEYGVSAVF